MTQTVFSEWSPESAYLFGLFYADGHLRKNLHSAGIATKDKQLADLVHILVSGSWIKEKQYPVKDGERVLSRIFFDKATRWALHKMGMPAGKKFDILQWPAIPPECARDFVRGFFDGDGGISDKTTLSFYSQSVGFLETIERIGGALSCYRRKPRLSHNKRCYSLDYSSIPEVALWGMYMYLYPTTGICLERKRDLIFSLLGVDEIPDTLSLNLV